MSLALQQHETHRWRAAKIPRGKTAGQCHENYILSLMLYQRLCDRCPKLHVAIADHVGPLA